MRSVFEDNGGAVVLAQKAITNSNSKHIDVRYSLIRELVVRKILWVVHVAAPFQHADIFTKQILRQLFELHGNLVMT